jgi:hypothetical protein
MKKFLFCIALAACFSGPVNAADTARVLFIGNSYTAVNNLPDIISQMALSGGDVLQYSSNTPGGSTFQQHSGDATTLSLIAQGGWDYVVLQGQSQMPSFPDNQVATEVYPYAKILDSLVHQSNPCAHTVFYMTWGRENGDASNCPVFPPVCTYEGMDSLLQLRYTIMADSNSAFLSPVGRVWHSLRQNNPGIDLYQADESHPTENGSFAAACSFYSLFFNKNPANLNYNYTLNAADAAIIKTTAENIVFDSLTFWQRFDPLPTADFIFVSNGNGSYNFMPSGYVPHVTGYEWNFGDGSPNAFLTNPTHTFTTADSFTVCLTVFTPCDTVTTCKTIGVGPVGIGDLTRDKDVILYPNPVKDLLRFRGKKGNYQYDLFTITGKKLRSGTVTVPGQLSIGSASPGMYILQMQDEKGRRETLKITVSK